MAGTSKRKPTRLTPKSVEDARHDIGGRIEMPDAATAGLYLIVQPTGSKSWAVRYRINNRSVKYSLGKYPMVSLADARLAAAQVVSQVAHGIDPAEARREAKTIQPPEVITLRYAYERYRNEHLSTKKSGHDTHLRLNLHIVPYFGERDIRSLTSDEITDRLEDIVEDGKKIPAANRVRSTLHTCMNWCIKKKMLSINPCVGVEDVGEEQSRERVLSIDEIRLFLQACRATPAPWGQLGRMLLLTGQRRSEVAGMTTAEVSMDWWTIPKRRTKNGLEHIVPLVDDAIDVLRDLPAKILPGSDVGYYFSTMHDRPVCGFAKGKAYIAEKMIEIRAAEHAEKMDGSPSQDRRPAQMIPDWTYHDLRRTMATGLQRLKVPIEVTEAILNHRSGKIEGIAAIYQRHDYVNERREALEKWAAELRRIESLA